MPVLKLRGETLNYVSEGDGPPLLLIHSLGTASWLWEAQVRHWRSRFRVVAADCRGHGRSGFGAGATMEGNAQDLATLLQALDLKDLTVVGLSMGGVIATHLYGLAGDRIRGLVLADTFCHMPGGADRIAGLEKRLGAVEMDEFARAYAEETLLRPTAERLAALARGIAATSKEAYLQTVRSLFVQDTREALAKVDVPVLVLVGDQDQRTPRPMAEAVAQAAPRARLEVIPDAAHLANLDNPQAFQQAVDRFLSGLGR